MGKAEKTRQTGESKSLPVSGVAQDKSSLTGQTCFFGKGSLCVSNAKLMKQAMEKGDNARAYKLVSAFIDEYEKKGAKEKKG